MYSVQQMQAADYVLRLITKDQTQKHYNKNLKFLVEVNHSLWIGDFLEYESISPVHHSISDSGFVAKDVYSPHSGISIVAKTWNTYRELVRSSNPFENMSVSPLMLDSILRIVDQAKILPEDSPFLPYLLNAQSLNGETKLPFLFIGSKTINPVSIIQLNE